MSGESIISERAKLSFGIVGVNISEVLDHAQQLKHLHTQELPFFATSDTFAPITLKNITAMNTVLSDLLRELQQVQSTLNLATSEALLNSQKEPE